MSFMDFSSWPREQEQTLRRLRAACEPSRTKKAFTVGVIAGVVVPRRSCVGIYAGVEPDTRDMTKDMNMSNLTKKSKKRRLRRSAGAEAPAPSARCRGAEGRAAPSAEPAAAPAEAKK